MCTFKITNESSENCKLLLSMRLTKYRIHLPHVMDEFVAKEFRGPLRIMSAVVAGWVMHLACDWNMSNFAGAKAMLLLLLGSINTTEVTRNPVSDGVEVGSLGSSSRFMGHRKWTAFNISFRKIPEHIQFGGRGGGWLFAAVGKLLLKSSGVTLLPLLVKVHRYLYSVTHFYCNGSVTITSYWYFKCNEVVTSYYKN